MHVWHVGNELMHHAWFMKTKELVRPGNDMGKHACFFLSSFPICTQPTVFAYVLSLVQNQRVFSCTTAAKHMAKNLSANTSLTPFQPLLSSSCTEWHHGQLAPCIHAVTKKTPRGYLVDLSDWSSSLFTSFLLFFRFALDASLRARFSSSVRGGFQDLSPACTNAVVGASF